MKRINITNTEKLAAAIKEAEGRATARTINVEGILKFANVRNINLINSSPTTYNAQAYKYTYSLSKDEKSNTVVKTLLTIR